jgi:hypothetical protein
MNLVEFALCVPIVFVLFGAPIQIERLWYRQFTLEQTAYDVARALGAQPGDAAALTGTASARVGAGTSAAVRIRSLASVPAAPPRRARSFDVIELDLSRPSGVGFPLPSSYVCRAHARELRLRESLP